MKWPCWSRLISSASQMFAYGTSNWQSKAKAHKTHNVLVLQHIQIMAFILQLLLDRQLQNNKALLKTQQISNPNHSIFWLRQLQYFLKRWVNLWNFGSKHIASTEHTCWYHRVNEKYQKVAWIRAKPVESSKADHFPKDSIYAMKHTQVAAPLFLVDVTLRPLPLVSQFFAFTPPVEKEAVICCQYLTRHYQL